MLESLERTDEVGAIPGLQRVRIADDKIAAHPGAQVDDHVDVNAAHPLDNLPVPVRMSPALSSLWIAHMDMRHGRACARRLDDRIGNLLRSDRDRWMLANRVARTSHRAGHDNLRVHPLPSRIVRLSDKASTAYIRIFPRLLMV